MKKNTVAALKLMAVLAITAMLGQTVLAALSGNTQGVIESLEAVLLISIGALAGYLQQDPPQS